MQAWIVPMKCDARGASLPRIATSRHDRQVSRIRGFDTAVRDMPHFGVEHRTDLMSGADAGLLRSALALRSAGTSMRKLGARKTRYGSPGPSNEDWNEEDGRQFECRSRPERGSRSFKPSGWLAGTDSKPGYCFFPTVPHRSDISAYFAPVSIPASTHCHCSRVRSFWEMLQLATRR